MALCRKKLLITAPIDFLPELKKAIQDETDALFSYGADHDQIKVLLKGNAFDGWMVAPCPTYFIDREMLTLCPSLKIIATPSTGSNHIEVSYLQEKGIKLYTLRESNSVSQIYASSEYTFNLMISTIRKTPFAFQSVLHGKWREAEFDFRGRELHGLTLGIIGFGRIGSNLARYSLAFGMKIIAFDPYATIENHDVVQFNNINEMLPEADVIVVSVHLNQETYKMINDSVFSLMKDGVYFINTSRGDIVDENDFLKYLMNGKIEAAGVDVISDELTSDINDNILVKYARKEDNLIITPHIAGLTYDSERKAQAAAYNAIKKFFNE
jgi:phosphoglycerate dehydrogenase-like enzyme